MDIKQKKVLSAMFEELKKAPIIYQPSAFWTELNKVHLSHLLKNGLKDFKRTINTRYFNWGGLGILVHQLRPILTELIRGNVRIITSSEFETVSKNNHLEDFIYRIYLSCLFEYVLRVDTLFILENIKEPLVGDPLIVKYKGKTISQDLCNSVYDFYSAVRGVTLPEKARIAELGAGYGRLGYVFLKTLSDSSYCIIDIPPALFIAQNYLSEVFPKEKIFKFRAFKSFSQVKKEFEESRIRFLMPHQIELLPKNYFDLVINISSLHEMTHVQIKNYIKQINRICIGYFYTKQWRRSRIQDNNYIQENEYPIPKNWTSVYRRSRHPIQNWFFDSLYKINNSKHEN